MAKNTSILLGEHFENFVNEKISSGKFSSVSEVIRTALRLLETEENRHKALIKELEIGEKSGFVKDFDRTENSESSRQTPKEMKFIIGEKANEDIEKIWLYTYENWSLNVFRQVL